MHKLHVNLAKGGVIRFIKKLENKSNKLDTNEYFMLIKIDCGVDIVNC